MAVKVFISYSWDSDVHKEWVASLCNTLRSTYGIEAKADNFLNVSNLNKMMVQEISSNEKIILVVTKAYTEKADSFKDGVGYETELLINKIRENENSIIVIKKENCKLPFYIANFKYIDFIKGAIQDNLDELVRRINGIVTYKLAELNSNPRKVVSHEVKDILDMDVDDLIPDLKEYTVSDLDNFVAVTFAEMIDSLKGLFEKTKQKNANFDYHSSVKNVTEGSFISFDQSRKTVEVHYFRLLKNGNEVYRYKLWCNNAMGRGAIYGVQTRLYESDALNSYSFYAIFNFSDKQKKMEISVPMSFSVQKQAENGKDLAKIIFNEMKPYMERQV